MARADALGMFWLDEPPVKAPPKEKPKRTPPERTWEHPDYLPGLAEARAFNVQIMDDVQILAAMHRRETFIFDIECYPNYFLAAFTSLQTGKVCFFEMTPDKPLDIGRLVYVLHNFCIVGFNSISYDMPITALALAGKSCEVLKYESDQIIVFDQRGSDILRKHKVKSLKINHIDLIEVAPLRASLKLYGGRLHAPRMQDLPFAPATVLSEDQISIVRWYCVNDLSNTAFLRNALAEQLSLRDTLSDEYGIDLRSKSDAQIAEAVIGDEISRTNGARAQRPNIDIGTAYRYKVPHFLQYRSEIMKWTLNVVQNAWFVVDESGSIGMPAELKELQIQIGDSVYRMGIGGLHSSEKGTAHFADATTLLIDRDVVSYYPFIILLLGLFPHHLGPNFLTIFRRIVERRIAAKRRGDKVIADSLKITINGSFGKLGSKYSVLYSPDLLIQVTVTGQLSLLLLIERLELAGIKVVSANTDGVVIKCPKHLEATMDAVVKQWESDTGFETEANEYLALFSRDVNNYVAVKAPTKKSGVGIKAKGAYAKAGLSKNPTNEICVDAIEALFTTGTPVDHTVRTCRDIRKFVSVRTVKGGAVKDGVYLGKSIRWYYATGEDAESEIVYANNGNKVPRSNGAKPLMDLPATFPEDVDYDWYIQQTFDMLKDVGYGV